MKQTEQEATMKQTVEYWVVLVRLPGQRKFRVLMAFNERMPGKLDERYFDREFGPGNYKIIKQSVIL